MVYILIYEYICIDFNVHRQNVPRQNVPMDKTSQDKASSDIKSQGQNVLKHKVPGTKRPKRQNVPSTKCPKEKTSQETKRPTLISKLSKTHFCVRKLATYVK